MANDGEDKQESLLSFPCEFTLKIFGNDDPAFQEAVLQILTQEVPNFSEDAVQKRASKNGNYLALSVTIYATSREQLDRIYQALSDSPNILMVI